MFPEAMNATNSKKVSELWEDEKKYRWWIIGFIFSLVALFAFHLTVLILSYVNRDSLILHFEAIYTTHDNPSALALEQFNGMAMTSIGMTIAFSFCVGTFVFSIFNCYKAKSFEKIDLISSFFLGFQTFFSLFSLIQIFMGSQGFTIISGNTIVILYFVLKFLTIPVWLIFSRQIKKIKRSFFMAKRQEEIEAFYAANPNMDPTNAMNNPFPQQTPFPFGFQPRRQQQNPAAQPQTGEVDVTTASSTTNEKAKGTDAKTSKLQLMTVPQLKKIADKLSISGYEEMKKPELIKIILSVSQTLGSEDETNSNDEIDIDVDNKAEIKSSDSKVEKSKKTKESKIKKDKEKK